MVMARLAVEGPEALKQQRAASSKLRGSVARLPDSQMMDVDVAMRNLRARLLRPARYYEYDNASSSSRRF